MVRSERPIIYKVLLVDDDDAVRDMMTATLEHKGFGVVAVANVTAALKLITTETFDVLITDLHMPNPGDGFMVVTAMRHSQPNALTLLVSGYPDVQSAMAAILLEADEIIVKRSRGEDLRTSSTKRCLPANLSSGWYCLCIPSVVYEWR
jgi:DNA-binding NtrC family response regulator